MYSVEKCGRRKILVAGFWLGLRWYSGLLWQLNGHSVVLLRSVELRLNVKPCLPERGEEQGPYESLRTPLHKLSPKPFGTCCWACLFGDRKFLWGILPVSKFGRVPCGAALFSWRVAKSPKPKLQALIWSSPGSASGPEEATSLWGSAGIGRMEQLALESIRTDRPSCLKN